MSTTTVKATNLNEIYFKQNSLIRVTENPTYDYIQKLYLQEKDNTQ